MQFFLIIAIILIIVAIKQSKIHIDFKTFFKKGFKKIDNQFRIILLYWKTRKG